MKLWKLETLPNSAHNFSKLAKYRCYAKIREKEKKNPFRFHIPIPYNLREERTYRSELKLDTNSIWIKGRKKNSEIVARRRCLVGGFAQICSLVSKEGWCWKLFVCVRWKLRVKASYQDCYRIWLQKLLSWRYCWSQ